MRVDGAHNCAPYAAQHCAVNETAVAVSSSVTTGPKRHTGHHTTHATHQVVINFVPVNGEKYAELTTRGCGSVATAALTRPPAPASSTLPWSSASTPPLLAPPPPPPLPAAPAAHPLPPLPPSTNSPWCGRCHDIARTSHTRAHQSFPADATACASVGLWCSDCTLDPRLCAWNAPTTVRRCSGSSAHTRPTSSPASTGDPTPPPYAHDAA